MGLRSVLLIIPALFILVGNTYADVSVEDKRVSIAVAQQSLTQVLGRVAEITGASIDVSPKVERPVSISISNMPIQRAMDQIAKQESLNIVLGWRRDNAGDDHLTSINVLPDGNMDPDQLAKEDAARTRTMMQQQKVRKGGRAIPGGAEDKSWRGNRPN